MAYLCGIVRECVVDINECAAGFDEIDNLSDFVIVDFITQEFPSNLVERKTGGQDDVRSCDEREHAFALLEEVAKPGRGVKEVTRTGHPCLGGLS